MLRNVAEGANTYKVTFCSRQMYADLERLGGSPRKSRTIGFPDVPAELLPHFVRGVVDGDGTLGWNGDRPIVQVYSGSTVFLDGLVVAVERATGVPAPHRTANRDNWYVKWNTIRAKCVVGWLYAHNAGVTLPRKGKLADDIIAWQPKKMPQRGSVTERMREMFPAYIGQGRDVGDSNCYSPGAESKYFSDSDSNIA